jgi:hypothetical protein
MFPSPHVFFLRWVPETQLPVAPIPVEVRQSDEELFKTPEQVQKHLSLSVNTRKKHSPQKVRDPSDKYRYSNHLKNGPSGFQTVRFSDLYSLNGTHLSGFPMVKTRLFCHEFFLLHFFIIKRSRLVVIGCPDTFVRFSNAFAAILHSKTGQIVWFWNGPRLDRFIIKNILFVTLFFKTV